MKILLCDIDEDFLEILTTHLSWFGISVDVCREPSEVLERLKLNAYNMFICSSWLGSIDGFTLCGPIRHTQHQNLKNLNILILTYEVPEFEEMKFLCEKKISIIDRFSSPKLIAEKMETITMNQKTKKEIC